MANTNHEPEATLIAPPEKTFAMTSNDAHIVPKELKLCGAGLVKTQCNRIVTAVGFAEFVAESEICQACLLTPPEKDREP